jgi:superfamily II DNA helicase RecQ
MDILKLLRLSPPRLKTFVMSFNRPNLHYEVRYKSGNEDPYPFILEMIRQFNSRRQARLTREDSCNIILRVVTYISWFNASGLWNHIFTSKSFM